MNTIEFTQYLKSQIHKAGSQKEFARLTGISESYLSDVLRSRRDPGEKLLKAVGVKRVVTYYIPNSLD